METILGKIENCMSDMRGKTPGDALRVHAIVLHRINPRFAVLNPVIYGIRKLPCQLTVKSIAYGMNPGMILQRCHLGIERIRKIRAQTG
jgi:hypothetical protein